MSGTEADVFQIGPLVLGTTSLASGCIMINSANGLLWRVITKWYAAASSWDSPDVGAEGLDNETAKALPVRLPPLGIPTA